MADHSILNDQWKIHINKFATWREDLELVRLENSLRYKKKKKKKIVLSVLISLKLR